MLQHIPLVLVIIGALAVRVHLNRGQTWGTPDERTYSTYAQKWSPGPAYRVFIHNFLTSKDLDIPPTRYGFFLVCAGLYKLLRAKDPYRVVTWVAAVSGALAAGLAFRITNSLPASLLVATASLSLLLSRRALQDTFAALVLLLAVWAVHLQNVWLLGFAMALVVASREALLLYLPALYAAWGLKTGMWATGVVSMVSGGLTAVAGYHALGGRSFIAIFQKLRQKTPYVRRLQSGAPHRVLVDLVMVSPVTTFGAAIATIWAPLWLSAFTIAALVLHAFATPKNVRFLLVVDLTARMLCAWLPAPWCWGVAVLGGVGDILIYWAFKPVRDPVTYNLVVASGMYLEE